MQEVTNVFIFFRSVIVRPSQDWNILHIYDVKSSNPCVHKEFMFTAFWKSGNKLKSGESALLFLPSFFFLFFPPSISLFH